MMVEPIFYSGRKRGIAFSDCFFDENDYLDFLLVGLFRKQVAKQEIVGLEYVTREEHAMVPTDRDGFCYGIHFGDYACF